MSRRAFTLVEMLVSLAITLLMMGAVVSLFGTMADSVSGSRAVIEMSDRLRSCRNLLQADLQGVTVTMLPPRRPENDEGYFEAIEGKNSDSLPNANTVLGYALDTRYGDTDDILMFTTRSSGEPFVGLFTLAGPVLTTINSQAAEVAWFLVPDATRNPPPYILKTPTTFTLYRRVRLINPLLTPTGGNLTDDISMGQPPNYLANTLGDLTKPENRWLHVAPIGGGFPYRMLTAEADLQKLPFGGNRLGDDIMLTNVLAFDVQVWDPMAPLFVPPPSKDAVEPRDRGYQTAVAAYVVTVGQPVGAYVDLGYFQPYWTAAHQFKDLSVFSGAPNLKCGTQAYPFCFDTWSSHYENDGLLQKGQVIDSGTNGRDDNVNNFIDDAVSVNPATGADTGEADTLPPYPAPLRGVRVTIRVFEPSTQQIRQITVIQEFLSK